MTLTVLDPHTLVSNRTFTAMLVWSVFFSNLQKMFVYCYHCVCIFYWYCTR